MAEVTIKKVSLSESEIKLNPEESVQSAKVHIGTHRENYRQKVYKCRGCGVSFKSKKACKSREPAYCSWDCYMKSATIYANMVFVCEFCGKEFKTNKAYKGRIPKYCSLKCFGAHAKGKGIKGISRGHIPWNKGIKLSSENRKALSEGRKNSPKCKGPNLYNWKGGESTFRDRSRVYQNNRRAREMDCGLLDQVFLRYLWDAHKGLCFYCESPLTDYKCLEHLTPLSRGGKNQPFNLVYSCKSCNSKKRQKTLEDFAIETGRIWLVDKWEDIFIAAYSMQQEAMDEISETINS